MNNRDTKIQSSYDAFEQSNCCVLVPTYNNSSTLSAVLNSVLEYTDRIIVVDDGSTDETEEILLSFPALEIFRYEKNKGKGYALRLGFIKARELGYRYAISIDSDGQHFASDLPGFLEAIKNSSDTLFVGARNMEEAGAPGKSNFGLRFSNFWYWVNTGISLPDTQSGYRLYPVERMKNIRWVTRRFEFEIEVLVRSAWRKIPVKAVPVKVYYPPEGERVSHFRPFMDFFRISVLNTVLVILALLWFRPYLFFSQMTWKSFKALIRKELLNPEESNRVKVASVMLGAFMGVAPVWGWQMAIALGLAIAFKLNKVITLAVSNLSIPPMIPIILYLSYITGGLIFGQGPGIDFSPDITFEFVTENLFQYVIGSLIFGVILALVLGFITYIALLIFRKEPPAKITNKTTVK